MDAEPQLPQKRASLPTPEDSPPAKRLRTESPNPFTAILNTPGTFPVEAPSNEYHVYRHTLQRSIGLALEHVGFDDASEESLESFTIMTETYLNSLCKDVMSFANHARRNLAIPTDFELTLQDFNISQRQLSRHRENVIPLEKIKGPERVTEHDETEEGNTFKPLPCISEELSGKSDKEARKYIPSFFPDFPSIHTYKYTAVDKDSVTVREPIHEAHKNAKAPPIPDWRGDPKKIREAAALQAKQAEENLTNFNRVSKKAGLRGLQSTAYKNEASKKRYEAWQEAMEDVLAAKGDLAHGMDVADHSMVVNASKKFHRRQVPRSKRQKAGETFPGRV